MASVYPVKDDSVVIVRESQFTFVIETILSDCDENVRF